MCKKLILSGYMFFCFLSFYAQSKKNDISIGFRHGFGNEFKNRNYSYSNNYYKVQFSYVLKQTRHFKYELFVQPELNFASHQLLNLYFVQPDEPDYIRKREEYMRLKNIKEHILNLGFLVRKPISKTISVYVLASVGPMVTDTETERLSKGFAFSDDIALGFSFKVKNIALDIQSNARHVSNAGIQSSNAGFNTKNIEFGLTFPLN